MHALELKLLTDLWHWLPRLVLLMIAVATVAVWSRRPTRPRTARLPEQVGILLIGLVFLDAFVSEANSARYGSGPIIGMVPNGHLLQRGLPILNLLIPLLSACLVGLCLANPRSMPSKSWRAAMTTLPFSLAWAISTLLGTVAGADQAAWTAWGAFTALSFLRLPAERALGIARYLTRALIVVSIIVAYKSPGWSYAPYSVWPGGWHPGVARLQGIMPQPNPLGWIAAASLVLEWGRPSRVVRRLPWLLMAGWCLYESGSRTALVAVLAGFVFLVGRPSVAKHGRRLVAAGAMLAVVALLVAGERAGESSTLNGRRLTWTQALAVWRQNRVFGSGPGAFYRSVDPTLSIGYAHNQLLHSMAELGLVGALAVLWLFGRQVVAVTRGRAPQVAVALSVCYAALALTENPLRFTNLTFLLPLLPGLLVILAAHDPAANEPLDVSGPEAEARPGLELRDRKASGANSGRPAHVLVSLD